PVFDADRAVHDLYGPGGAAVPLIETAFPGVTRDGKIDRALLAERVLDDPDAIARLEAIVHPLVRKLQRQFIDEARSAGADLVVLAIPLLFETRGEANVDKVVVVTAPAHVQRQRALARPGMTERKLNSIRATQMPDSERRRGADFSVETDKGFEHARGQVGQIVATIRAEANQERS